MVQFKIYKVRIIATCFTQVPGVDFDEIFSPMVKLTIVQILLTLITHDELEVHQLDVKIVFFNSYINEEIYIYIWKF